MREKKNTEKKQINKPVTKKTRRKRKLIREVSRLNVAEKQLEALKVNTWEDQLVEEAASDWEAFHPRQPKPSSSPSLCALLDGNA
jgi:hypothetical protein